MNKKQLAKKIKELKSHLTSQKAFKAIEILEQEISLMEDESEKQLELIVPKELISNNSLGLFTDGACSGNPGPGAWAFMLQDHRGEVLHKQSKHSAHTTNNKMELTAIIEGLLFVKNKFPNEKLYVYTDSKYAVDGIKSWVSGWKRRGWKKADKKEPENLELWKKLDQLNNDLEISFHWVKGHSGHPQNEYVDKLANIELDENGF